MQYTAVLNRKRRNFSIADEWSRSFSFDDHFPKKLKVLIARHKHPQLRSPQPLFDSLYDFLRRTAISGHSVIGGDTHEGSNSLPR